MDVVIPVISNEDFLGQLFSLLGGLKGASTLAIVAVAVQLLMKFVGTQIFDGLSGDVGKYKLLLFTGSTLILGVVTQVSNGMALVPALFGSSTIAAFMVFANQVYKQFFTK